MPQDSAWPAAVILFDHYPVPDRCKFLIDWCQLPVYCRSCRKFCNWQQGRVKAQRPLSQGSLPANVIAPSPLHGCAVFNHYLQLFTDGYPRATIQALVARTADYLISHSDMPSCTHPNGS
jgi:hypothetical protein